MRLLSQAQKDLPKPVEVQELRFQGVGVYCTGFSSAVAAFLDLCLPLAAGRFMLIVLCKRCHCDSSEMSEIVHCCLLPLQRSWDPSFELGGWVF